MLEDNFAGSIDEGSIHLPDKELLFDKIIWWGMISFCWIGSIIFLISFLLSG